MRSTKKPTKTNRYVLNADVVKARLKELGTNASTVSQNLGMHQTYLSCCMNKAQRLNLPTVIAISKELLYTDWEKIVMPEEPEMPEFITTHPERESQISPELLQAMLETNRNIEAQLENIVAMLDKLGRAILVVNSTCREAWINNAGSKGYVITEYSENE